MSDDFERIAVPVPGLAEVLDRYRMFERAFEQGLRSYLYGPVRNGVPNHDPGDEDVQR